MMKLGSFILCLMCITSFSQVTNEVFIVEQNKNVDVTYLVYDPPLRINRVKSQSEIDYTKLEGLLQSYLSADNFEWALSEYIDGDPKSVVRSKEHFEAIKTKSINDYIQLESAYLFQYNNSEYAFVKYSKILEKLPFPWVSMFIMEKKNNRWYFSKLINQNELLNVLGKYKPGILLEIFNQKSDDSDVKKIISGSFKGDRLSIRSLVLLTNQFDKRLKVKFFENRAFNDKLKNFRNAMLLVSPKEFSYSISQPFLLQKFEIISYDNSKNNLIESEEDIEKFKKEPEYLILKDSDSTKLIAKIKIVSDKTNYFLIKYQLKGKFFVKVLKEITGMYVFDNNSLFNDLASVFKNNTVSHMAHLLANPKKEFEGSDGGVNLNEFIFYFEN